MVTHSRCRDFEPNDWVVYVDYRTGIALHIDRFYNEQRGALKRFPEPPGGWNWAGGWEDEAR